MRMKGALRARAMRGILHIHGKRGHPLRQIHRHPKTAKTRLLARASRSRWRGPDRSRSLCSRNKSRPGARTRQAIHHDHQVGRGHIGRTQRRDGSAHRRAAPTACMTEMDLATKADLMLFRARFRKMLLTGMTVQTALIISAIELLK